MGFRRLPFYVRWALFVVPTYALATGIRALVEAYPTQQADIQFNAEFLFWMWIIPTGLHYLLTGIARLLSSVEARRPLPGASADELAWKVFSRDPPATQERDAP